MDLTINIINNMRIVDKFYGLYCRWLISYCTYCTGLCRICCILFDLVYPRLDYNPWSGILFWINQFGFRTLLTWLASIFLLLYPICDHPNLAFHITPKLWSLPDLVQVLKEQQAQAWLPDLPGRRGLPGLQEYLPPCWLSCLTGPEDLKDSKVPMVQQARFQEVESSMWTPGAFPKRIDGYDMVRLFKWHAQLMGWSWNKVHLNSLIGCLQGGPTSWPDEYPEKSDFFPSEVYQILHDGLLPNHKPIKSHSKFPKPHLNSFQLHWSSFLTRKKNMEIKLPSEIHGIKFPVNGLGP